MDDYKFKNAYIGIILHLLYIGFLKNKTEENKGKHKKYKNKLKAILKDCKKDYYANLLIKHKNNIEQIWKILNTITKGDKNEHSTPAEFLICKGNEINKKEVANELNNFFCKHRT